MNVREHSVMTECAKSAAALLLGAGDAIGAAVARRFAAGGYRVCIARRDAAKSRDVVQQIIASGGVARAVGMDVRNEPAVQALFAEVEAELGPIDVCLFNAGANVKAPLADTDARLFFKAWELACYAGFLTGREAARYMVPRGRGTILFTGATASLRGGSGFAAFAAAKFGLRALAQSMARELAPKNIWGKLLVAPGEQRPQHRPRVAAGFGQDVFVARRSFAIASAFEQALFDHGFEPSRQDVGRNAQVLLELVEPRQTLNASRRMRMLHHSPTRSRLRAIGHCISRKLLGRIGLRCTDLHIASHKDASRFQRRFDCSPGVVSGRCVSMISISSCRAG